MGLFFGILIFENGFIILYDTMPNAVQASQVIKINEHNVVALANDLEDGKNFCEQYILGSIKENDDIFEIINLTNNAFQKLDEKYKGKILTMHFLGYDSKLQQKIFHSILFDGNKIIYNSRSPSQQKTLFTFEVNLGTFIVNKVYSSYMSLQDAKNLMGYVLTQYRMLYPDAIGKGFNMFTVSESGVHALTDKEVNEILEHSEKTDMQIRKDCTNFFLTNDTGMKK